MADAKLTRDVRTLVDAYARMLAKTMEISTELSDLICQSIKLSQRIEQHQAAISANHELLDKLRAALEEMGKGDEWKGDGSA
jgi:hypothetical protein